MATPLDILKMMTASTTDPTLTDAELDVLLTLNQRRDASGNVPTAVAWTPTYDLYAAAMEGWRWKAGKVSDLGNMRTGDLTIEENPIYEHCIKQVEAYARKVNFTATMVNRDFIAATTEVTG